MFMYRDRRFCCSQEGREERLPTGLARKVMRVSGLR
jgi:hypothetical protein